MSAGSIALDSGLAALLAVSGEPLTFRGSTVTALVDRLGYRGRDRQPDFTKTDMSRIEIATGAVTPDPRVGEDFTDGAGVRHRVQSIRGLGAGIVMECKTRA